MRMTIYFATNNPETIRRIRERFGMPMVGMTVNGELTCDVREDDLPLLRETEKLGFISIRNKNVTENTSN